MKKLIVGTIIAAVCASAFALKLPTGDNVRAADTKMDGDKILSVKLGGDKPSNITTPVGVLPAKSGTIVEFYPSGALKTLIIDWKDRQTIETSIGKMSLFNTQYFYESGSPARLTVTNLDDNDYFNLKIGNVDYTAYCNYESYIFFYDSGSKDVLQPQRVPYKPGDYKFSFKYTNKSGTFDLRPCSINNSDKAIYEFYPDGSLKGGVLKTSPDTPVMVNGTEVYIQNNSVIEFFQDGSISHFVPDELVQIEQGGIKFTVAAGNNVWLYKDGKIRVADEVKNITPASLTVGKKNYSASIMGTLAFDKEGKLAGLGKNIRNLCDTFYSDGALKRFVVWDLGDVGKQWNEDLLNGNFVPLSTGGGLTGYSKWFVNPKGKDVDIHETYVSIYDKATYSEIKFKLESGDYGVYIANVYFADNGDPTIYTTYKHDLFGNYILDEYGRPVEDTTRKKFTK